jgi:hypothetical protein
VREAPPCPRWGRGRGLAYALASGVGIGTGIALMIDGWVGGWMIIALGWRDVMMTRCT